MMGHSRASWADTTEVFQVARATADETHGATVGMPMIKRPGVEQNAGALALDESVVVRIREALIFAAREQAVVSYRDFHAFFGGAGTLRKRFELLDRIVHELADPADADYGSLMANSQGLPGPEFLRRYRVFHADEYENYCWRQCVHPAKVGAAVSDSIDRTSARLSSCGAPSTASPPGSTRLDADLTHSRTGISHKTITSCRDLIVPFNGVSSRT
jgi:hypothetical protein